METKDFEAFLELIRSRPPKVSVANGEVVKVVGISQQYTCNTFEVVLDLVKDGASCGIIYGASIFVEDWLFYSRVKLWWFGELRVDTLPVKFSRLDDLILKVLSDQSIELELEVSSESVEDLESKTLKIFIDCMALNNGLPA